MSNQVTPDGDQVLTPDQQSALDAYNAQYGEGEKKPTGESTEGTPDDNAEDVALEIPEDEGNPNDTLAGFESPEALLEAYNKLKEGKPDDVIEDVAKGDTKEETEETPDLNMDLYKTEVFKEGKLSDESLEALTKAGVPKAFIDSFIGSVASEKEAVVTSMYEIAGGKAEYQELLSFAGSLDTDYKAYLNSQLKSGSPILIKGAIKSIKAMYDTAEGTSTSTRVHGTRRPSSPSRAFTSNAEMVEAMKDPRWKTDRAYTEEVTAKASKSTF